MQNLIPIHSSTMVYAMTGFINLALGSFFVCSHVYEKWLKQFDYSLMDVNALIKGMIVLLGFLIMPSSDLFKGDIVVQSISIVFGCITGYAFFKFELFAVKQFPYQKRLVPGEKPGVKKNHCQ